MSLFKKLFAAASTVAMLAAGLGAPATALAVAHSAGSVVKASDGTIWFIDNNNQRRAFTSLGAFNTYGFLSLGQVVDANTDDTGLNTGAFIPPRDGSIFCATATKGTDVAGECALITGGMKAAFTSSAVFTGQGFSFARAQYGDSSFLTKTSNIDNAGAAHRMGVLVNNNGTVQLVGSTSLLGIPSIDVFNSWGYSFADVVPANAADLSWAQSGVMCARVAGELNPSFSGNCGSTNPPSSSADCDDLTGGAGSVDDYNLVSGLGDEEVGEDQEDVEVAGLEVEADEGSDLCLTAVRLVFNEGTANQDFEDYASEVSLWFDGDEIARVDADEFNDDNDWTSTISLDGASLAAGEIAELTVAVSGISNLDSGDAGETWNVDFRQIRFEDADGATISEDPGTAVTSFSFEVFANAADLEFKITAGELEDDVNDAHVINIHATDETDGVAILSFNVEIEGDSDVNLEALPVLLTVGGAQDNVDEMVGALSLEMDGEEIGTASMSSDCRTDADCVAVGTSEDYLFDDLDQDLEAGESYEFVVYADIYGITDTGDVAAGDTLLARFGEVETDDTDFDAEDETGESLAGGNTATDGDVTGTVTGSASEVRDVGFNAEFVSGDADVVSGEVLVQSDAGTFEIVFDVTPFDGDIFIDSTAPLLTGSVATGGADESDVNQDGNVSGDVTCTIAGVSGFTTVTNSFRVDEDDTGRFRITCDVRDGTTDLSDGFTGISLGNIVYALTDVDGDLAYTFDLADFKTPQVFLDDRGF